MSRRIVISLLTLFLCALLVLSVTAVIAVVLFVHF